MTSLKQSLTTEEWLATTSKKEDLRVLFLQGPLGPFFQEFGRLLADLEIPNWQVAFNGGDWLYSSSSNRLVFNDEFSRWKNWLETTLKEKRISHVIVYGDCRVYHQVAAKLCEELGLQFYVFEGGYIRPNFVTFEEHGANANSKVDLQAIEDWYDNTDELESKDTIEMKSGFWRMVVHAAIYYIAMAVGAKLFQNYVHHRGVSAIHEGFCWWRSGLRKLIYKFTEVRRFKKLAGRKYFLVPLQVYNDAQITHHSPFFSMEEFIQFTFKSFAKHAPKDCLLVVKHHPMDRGHTQYEVYIQYLAKSLGISDRVLYLHDQNLPKMLDHCEGVVSINSTTVISAFHHKAPVIILGDAFYNISGLADDKPLSEFWKKPEKPNELLYKKFREYLRYHNQLNGDLYRNSHATILAAIQKLDREKKVITPKIRPQKTLKTVKVKVA